LHEGGKVEEVGKSLAANASGDPQIAEVLILKRGGDLCTGREDQLKRGDPAKSDRGQEFNGPTLERARGSFGIPN